MRQSWDIFKETREVLTEMAKGKGRGNWGHAGRPGKRGGSAPRRGRSTSALRAIPSENKLYLSLGPGEGLEGAKVHGRDIWSVMYNPKTGTLLVGDKNHAETHAEYSSNQNYDDFAKLYDYGPGSHLGIVVSRGGEKTESWDNAFKIGKVLLHAGYSPDKDFAIIDASKHKRDKTRTTWMKLGDFGRGA